MTELTKCLETVCSWSKLSVISWSSSVCFYHHHSCTCNICIWAKLNLSFGNFLFLEQSDGSIHNHHYLSFLATHIFCWLMLIITITNRSIRWTTTHKSGGENNFFLISILYCHLYWHLYMLPASLSDRLLSQFYVCFSSQMKCQSFYLNIKLLYLYLSKIIFRVKRINFKFTG